MIQWWGLLKERKIFNAKKKLGDKRNELGKQNNNKKNKIKKLKQTIILIRSNKFLKINNLQKPQWNTQRNNNVSIRHKMVSRFCLITLPPCPQTTRRKHRPITHLVQAQSKNQPNQCQHLMNNPSFRQKSVLTTKKYPRNNLIMMPSRRNMKC